MRTRYLAVSLLLCFLVCSFLGCNGEEAPQVGGSTASTTVSSTTKAPSDPVKPATAGLAYTLLDDGSYSVSCGDAKALSEIVIPETYEGKTVSTIADEGFRNCTALTAVTLPESITVIGHFAFDGCSALERITLKSGVRSIGEWAFSNCAALADIQLPDTLESISGCAFAYCDSLKKVTLPNSVTSVGWFLFSNSAGITDVKFGSGITDIGKYTFRNCVSLERVVLPHTLTTLDRTAFEDGLQVEDIYYGGTADEWDALTAGVESSTLAAATIYFYSETAPSASGTYWHFDGAGNPVLW